MEIYDGLRPKKIHATQRKEVDIVRDVAKVIFRTVILRQIWISV
ncbi:hypothetical protein C4K18_2685 [Pseudomonas chlororaphis subsp. aurantiaca]|nr:hypothetical protein C4K18_2685 [Pseudomonas chlororaphis subsp. aurantiaca]